MGICFTSTASLVPQWFTKRRSFANGLATSGTGFGGLTYSLASQSLIERVGLSWTFRIMAIICFVVLCICGLFLKDRNKSLGSDLNPLDWRLFKKIEMWLYLGWFWLSSLGYVVVIFSLADYAQKHGFSAKQGSLVSAMFNCESTGV